jgi:putative transposase
MAMAWRRSDVLSERTRFIAAWLVGEAPVTQLAVQFDVSRKTAYKWIERYRQEGPAGLHDKSRAPHSPAGCAPPALCMRVVQLRRAHPAWGPRKLKARLELDAPEEAWPAASTIGDILKREGLVSKRRLRHRVPPMSAPFADAQAPNDVWCIDFKGWWRTGDGKRIEPLTVSDAMSRFLIVCKPVDHPRFDVVWPLMARAFREYGLPGAIRSDNGPPFGSVAAGGLSRLAVNFVKMGIVPERIAPGKPQENGRHERLHLTLKREAATPPSRSARAQARRLECFRQSYNHERPHEALGQIPPGALYARSAREWDGKLHAPDYPDATETRSVRTSGSIKWRGAEPFISEVLAGEQVGLYRVGEDEYDVRYGPILLGRIDPKNRMRRLKPKRPGQNKT